jgi:hypothetical protein
VRVLRIASTVVLLAGIAAVLTHRDSSPSASRAPAVSSLSPDASTDEPPETVSPSPAAPPGPPVTTAPPATLPSGIESVPDSIPADCSADVSVPMQTWIDTVGDGSTLQFPPSGCYRVEDSLVIADRNHLLFDGQGVHFEVTTDGTAKNPDGSFVDPPPSDRAGRLWPRARALWIVARGSDITFQNLTITGPNTACAYEGQALEEQAAFHLDGVDGAVVKGTTVSAVYGDFVSVADDAHHVTVQGNTFDCSGRQGVSVVDGTDVLIDSNTLSDIPRSAFDLEPAVANWEVRRVTISHNTISKYTNVFIANLGAGGNVDTIVVDANVLHGKSLVVRATGPAAQPHRHGYRFTNNSSDESEASPLAMMRFVNIDEVVVQGNQGSVIGRYPDDGRIYSGDAVGFVGTDVAVVRDNVFAKEPHKPSGEVTAVRIDSSTNVTHCNNIINPGGVPPPADGACP